MPHSAHYAAPPVDPNEIDVIADVLEQASDQLTSLTAETVHPALQVVEDYTCYPGTSRLTPSYLPLRQVVALYAVNDDGTQSNSLSGVVSHGDAVRFVDADAIPVEVGPVTPYQYGYAWTDLGSLWFLQMQRACPKLARLRLVYNAGSTITASARQAVIALAHEFYLRVSPCDECGTCRLPSRTTNVIREGISFNVGDPLMTTTGTAMGATGLPDVDLWLRGVNPRQATRSSAVYTADAPPPVVRALVSARPIFPAVPGGRVATSARVTAEGHVG